MMHTTITSDHHQRAPPSGGSAGLSDPTEKKIHRLRKKLEAINTLKEKRDCGEKLEANQVRMHPCRGTQGEMNIAGACRLRRKAQVCAVWCMKPGAYEPPNECKR